ATGYDGYLSLEIFNDQFRGGSASAIAVDGRRSLIYLGDQVKRQQPESVLPVPVMPPRAKVEGIAFIEFTADEDEALALEALFASLGFRKAARHKSKRVTVFRQGAINLVVNTERKGFASASYAVHGTSAYAAGMMVDDAQAALHRAVALGAERFAQSLDAGE
ncbi:3-keto-5-aminohexanoate cleavage protein, partial [Rhizobium sp. 9T]|nr:3-keto-5-aminohexanoate cleavage protein [Rhizobium croatiense]